MNILIIGLGKIGGFLAYQILKYDQVERLFLTSRSKEKLVGIVTDLREAYPKKNIDVCELEELDENIDLTILSFSNLKWHDKIDVNDRIIEGKSNLLIIKQLLSKNRKIFSNLTLVISNPVDLLTRFIVESTENYNVFGFGISLDSKRISYSFNTLFPSSEYRKIDCIGEHGENIIPLLNNGVGELNNTNTIYQKIISHSFKRTGKIVTGYSIQVFGPWRELENALKVFILNEPTRYFFSVFLRESVFDEKLISIGMPIRLIEGKYIMEGVKASDLEIQLFQKAAGKLRHNYQNLLHATNH